jgi:uncharacterized protein RhaS with RHS repeats
MTPPTKIASWDFDAPSSSRPNVPPPANQDCISVAELYAYNPASGLPEWLSPDPIGEEGGLNLYAYVGNDPVAGFDPLGLCDTGAELTVTLGNALLDILQKNWENLKEELSDSLDELKKDPAGWWVANLVGTHGLGEGIPKGSIYKVSGKHTKSGKKYIGRHNKPDPAKTRRSNDGRDRTQAEVIDNYDPANTMEGREKEQQHIDANGGLPNLDNKRNEIRR